MAQYPSKVGPSDTDRKRNGRIVNILVEIAELQAVPDHFEMIHEDGFVVIIDRKTNRRSTIPLASYQVVRRVLNDLFA